MAQEASEGTEMRLRRLQFQARTFALISLVALLVVFVAIVYFVINYFNSGTSERNVDVVIVVGVLQRGAVVLLPALLVAIAARLVVRRNHRAIRMEQERIEAGLRGKSVQ